MGDFFSKIENFFFDIFGLILPGLLLILFIIMPIYFFDFSAVKPEMWNTSNFLSFVHYIYSVMHNLIKDNPTYLIVALFLCAYIIGHLIKVVSIAFYEFASLIFDNGVNKIVVKISGLVVQWTLKGYNWITHRDLERTVFYEFSKAFYKAIVRHVFCIFVFKSSSYFKDNESIKDDCMSTINARLQISFPNVWHSLYKVSTVLFIQENVRTLSNFFLSKYNLYRSLAVIFIFLLFYYRVFFRETEGFIPQELKHLRTVLFISICLLWYTFHFKFKRYWTLCGNEALMSFFYYLHKNKLKDA